MFSVLPLMLVDPPGLPDIALLTGTGFSPCRSNLAFQNKKGARMFSVLPFMLVDPPGLEPGLF
jgi:hypothetical protein